MLGRVSLRAGRIDEALTRLQEAHALFTGVKREEEALDVDARIAECRTFAGDPDAALKLLADALARATRGPNTSRSVASLAFSQSRAFGRGFESASDAGTSAVGL